MADFYSDIARASQVASEEATTLSPGSKDGRSKIWTYTQLAQGPDPTSVGVYVLRANEVVDTHHMSFATSGLGAGRVVAIGHDGYTLPDGTVVAPNLTALGSGIDVSNAGRHVVRDAPTNPVDSFGPIAVDVMITAQVSGGTFDASQTLNGSAQVGMP